MSVIGPTGIAFTSTGTLFVGDGPNLWRIAPLSPTQVTIDIKPGSDANTINLFSRFVSVAVLTTAIFDAATVDPTSVTLAGASVRMKGNSGTSGSLEDVDGDGDLDLVVQVLTEQMALTAGDIEAVLTGTTLGGTMIQGADTIRIVP